LADWTAETSRAGQALVICGDLNVAREDRDVHPKERKPNQIGTRPEERALLGRLFSSGLADVGRDLDPGNDALFTWWAPWRSLRQRNIGWRIDYVLASQGISTRARSSVSMREFGTSDHAPVVVTFDGVLS
jgi:exodeoxyribonuclease-3